MEISNAELKRLQRTELGILCDFALFCREHGLTYYLIGGALLGAIRYGGFIPWDDDIDVAMPREDYEQLKKVYRSDRYFLQNFTTDPLFARGIQKIRLNGTKLTERSTADLAIHQGIYIDIFPIDYVDSNDPAHISPRARRIRRLMSLNAIKSGYHSRRYQTVKRIIKALYPISKQTIEKRLYALCTKENHGARKYAILWLHNYSWDRQLHDAEVFGEGTECVFEGQKFVAPAATASFLQRVFGKDYLEEPSKEKQKMPHKYLKVEFLPETSDNHIHS